MHGKLEAENNRADKSDFETKRLLEKTEALSVERDRLQTERDTLKETNAELIDQVNTLYQIHRQCYRPAIILYTKIYGKTITFLPVYCRLNLAAQEVL